MPTERHAVYAGSFDPPTRGHIHILERATRLFDVVTVLVATNADKKRTPLLTPKERVSVFNWFADFWSRCAGTSGVRISVVRTAILGPRDYTVRFAHLVSAGFVVRGLRDGMDFEYERKLQFAQSRLCRRFDIPEPETVYLGSTLDDDLYTSSTLVHGLMEMDDWENAVGEFVPPVTLDILKRRLNGSHV